MSKLMRYLAGTTDIWNKYYNLEQRVQRLETAILGKIDDIECCKSIPNTKGSGVETLPEGKELPDNYTYSAAKFPEAYPPVELAIIKKLGES